MIDLKIIDEINLQMATEDELKRLHWEIEEIPCKRMREKLIAEDNRRQKYDY